MKAHWVVVALALAAGCSKTDKAKDKPADKPEDKGTSEPMAAKGKMTEAQLQLNKIGKSAKVAFVSDAAFPKGKAAMLPAKPCCPDKCPPAAWASDPVWKALDFQIDEPNLFQYTYESDGQTFTATAVGDLDCDGVAITYTLAGKVTNGNPEVNLTEPPPNTD
jgi:hypothetical protein